MPSTDHSSDASSPEAALRLLQAEDFMPLVGRSVRFAGASFKLVLDRVDRQIDGPAGLPRAPFSLLFKGPKNGTFLREGLYRFDFGEGTVFEIHVAPIHTPAADRQDYQAVFN